MSETSAISHPQPSRAPVILGWTGLTAFLVSVLALSILLALSYFHVIRPIPKLILYAPASGLGGIGAMMGLISFIIRQCTKPHPNKEPPSIVGETSPSKPNPSTEPSSITSITKPFDPNKIDKEILSDPLLLAIHGNKTLHPPASVTPFSFIDLPLLNLENEQDALTLFLLLCSDFMGLDPKGSNSNIQLTLSFLIKNLEQLKTKGLLKETQKLETQIQRFSRAYLIGSYAAQLSSVVKTSNSFLEGRRELRTRIIDTLEKEKSIILNGGYAANPAGHTILIELTLENGMVRGTVLNTGDGIQYHSWKHAEAKKYFALQLDDISLDALKTSQFLDLLIDLKMTELFNCDTEYGTQESTLYSKIDVYEILLPTWPGGISDRANITHSEQHGGSCSLQPFLDYLSENLGVQDSKTTKIYLQIQAFELLLAHVNFSTIDTKRIQDALAKFNRSLLAAEKKMTLPIELKKQVFVLSEQVQDKIKKAEEEQKTSLVSLKIDEPTYDNGNYALDFPLIWPFMSTNSPKKTISIPTLPPCLKSNFTEYLKEGKALVESCLNDDQTSEAKRIARQILFEIPQPSDVFWQSKRPEQDIHILTYLAEMLVKVWSSAAYPKGTTVNSSTLYLKVLAISLLQAKSGGISPQVISVYSAQTQMVIKDIHSSLHFTHPVYHEIFLDCLKIIEQFASGSATPILPYSQPYNAWILSEKNVKSVSEMIKDDELRFLHDFLQTHPELKNTFPDKQNWESEILNTLSLHRDNSFLLNKSDNVIYLNPQPEYEPIRQLFCLRKLYYIYLLSSYFVGEAIHADQTDFTYLGYSVSFGGRDTQANERTVLHNFKFHDPQNVQKGVFLDTFYPFSWQTKDYIANLNHELDQNQQLKLTERQSLDNDLTLSAIEIQRLYAIQTYDELTIPQLISFFTLHFHHLKDSRFQALFLHFLFQPNKNKSAQIIQEVLKSNSQVKDQLIQFLKLGFKRAETLKWHECQAFFFKALVQVTRYLAETDANTTLLKQTCEWAYQTMQNALRAKEIENPYLFSTFVSCAPYFDYAQGAQLFELSKRAKVKSFEKGNKKVEKNPQWLEDYLIGDTMLPTECQATEMLPNWVVSHNDYFFGHNYTSEIVEEGVYEFKDEKGQLYRIATEGHKIIIYHFFEGKWYKNIKETPFQKKALRDLNLDWHPCINGIFTRDVRIWEQLGSKEILIFSKTSSKLLCRVKEEGIFHPNSTEPLTLATTYSDPFIELIARLAPKNEILVWKDSQKKVVNIEIPILQLSFHFSEGKWKSSRYPGFYIDSCLECPSIMSYSHYLVLCNQKGKRIVIVPNNLVSTPQQQYSLKLLKAMTLSTSINSALMIYPLNKKGEIKIQEIQEKTFYLIYLAMRAWDYSTAKKIIDQIKQERPVLEKNWCLWIQKLDQKAPGSLNLDKHPEAISLRIQLRLLVKELSGADLDDNQIQALKKDYFLYLEQRKETFGVALSQKEELKCIKILNALSNTDQEKFSLALRRHNLDNSPLPSNQVLSFTNDAKNRARRNRPCITDDIKQKMVASIMAPKAITLLTRPGSALIDNFLYYYGIARHLPDNHPLYLELQQMLRITRFMEDATLFFLHTLLMNVMEKRQSFPTLRELVDAKKPLHELLEPYKECALIPKKEWEFSHKKPNIHCLTSQTHLFPSPAPTPGKIQSTAPLIGKKETTSLATLLSNHDYFQQKNKEAWEKEVKSDLQALKEMEDYYSSCTDENLCIVREFNRLVEGIKLKKHSLNETLQKNEPPYTLDQNKIAALKKELMDLNTQFEREIENKKRAILTIAHNYPESLILEKNGRLLNPLSLQELIVFFGTGTDKEFYASNPSLTEEDVKKLKQLIYDFLILSTNHQQLLRLAETIDSDSPMKNKVEVCAAIATAERVYDPFNEPHLLVFEFFGKIRLRSDQYKALKEMTGDEKDIELEARTGFGKSKVLIPLWLFLRSLKDKAAMMAVPASLFIAQQKHLKKILGKAYKAFIVPMQFNRANANDEKYLKKVVKKLKDAKENHKILLTTTQSLHAMTNLKLKETLALGRGEINSKLQNRLIELRNTIATQIAAFFDESKVCFSPKQVHDFAIGPLSSPDPKYFSSACSLYKEFFQNPTLKNFDFEFKPIENNDDKQVKIPVIQDNYDTEILPELVKNVANRFYIPQKFRAAVLQDLAGNYSAACEAFYKTLSEQDLEEYSRLQEQITGHLRRTLYKKSKDSFGFLPNSQLATPFLDGTSKKDSEFSEIEDYIDFTIQANLKRKFNQNDIALYINPLKVKSVEDNLKDNEMKFVKRLTPLSLMSLEDKDFCEIADYLNNNPILKLEFIEYAILPQMQVYQKKITSTAFNLIRAIHLVHAASGTVDPDSLPPRLHTKEDKTAVIDNLLALWKNSQDRLFTFCNEAAEKQLDDLLSKRKEETVLIDVAGTFREIELETLAKKILELRPNCEGVLLFDEEGRELIFERKSQSLVAREESVLKTHELFFFIRKSKAIGTDISIPLTAQALVTVDRDTTSDLFLQGTGRMRGLNAGQIVGYALSEADASIIKASHFRQLHGYVTRTSGKLKGDENFHVLKIYLEDLIDAAFWSAIAKCKNIDQVQELCEALEQFIVKHTIKPVLSTLRKKRSKVSAKDAVAQLKQELLEPVEQFCKKNAKWAGVFDIPEIKKQFDKFVDYNKLPKMIAISDSEGTISTVDTNVIQATEEIHEEAHEEVHEDVFDQIDDRELENENLSNKTSDLPADNYEPRPLKPWDGNYVSLFAGMSYHSILGIEMYFGPNFYYVSNDPYANTRVRKPAYQYMVHQNSKGKLTLMLLDLHDARAILKRMEQQVKHTSDTDSYYLLSGSDVIASDSKKKMLFLDPNNPQVALINVIRKLYTAQSGLTKKEVEHLVASPSNLKALIDHAEYLQTFWPHLAPFTAEIKALQKK